MSSSEIKMGFRPLNGRQIKVSGAVSEWRHLADRTTQRLHVAVCLQQPEYDGEVLATHVWVGHAEAIKEARVEPNERVSFVATVKEYSKNGTGRYLKDYMLDNPQDIHWPDREALALKIPAPKALPLPPVPTEESPSAVVRAAVPVTLTLPAMAAVEAGTLTPTPGSPVPDVLAVVRSVKRIAHEIGGKQNLLALIEEVLP